MSQISKEQALKVLETKLQKPESMKGSKSMSLFFAIHNIRSKILFYRPSESMPTIFKEKFDHFFADEDRARCILRDKINDAVGNLEELILFLYDDKDISKYRNLDISFPLSLCAALLNPNDETGAFYLTCFENIAEILGVDLNPNLNPLGWLEPEGPPSPFDACNLG